MWHVWGRRKMRMGFWLGNLKEEPRRCESNTEMDFEEIGWERGTVLCDLGYGYIAHNGSSH
jgi:hypothetical protein